MMSASRALPGMRRRMVRAALAAAGLVAASGTLAQAQRLPTAPIVSRLAIVVADGRVYVYPSRIPSDGEGWIITRDGVRLTPVPISGVSGPAEFALAVGNDIDLIQRITSTENSVGAYRRLRVGGTAAGVTQVLSPRAAAALGGLYVDSAVAAGSTHTYGAELVRLVRPDSVLRRATGTVRVVTMPVPAPGAATARAVDGTIALSWTPPRFTGATEDIVVAYVVERADSAGAFARITPLPVMRLTDQPSAHQDRALELGKLYRYRLRSADLIGRLSAPGPVVTVRAPAALGPLPPEQLATEVTDGRIRIVWTVSPEPRARGYVVERTVGGDSTYVRINRALVPADAPEFTDSLTRGREIYAYRVRAVDDAGRSGAPSNVTTARGLDDRPPGAPTALTATEFGAHRVRLTWRAPGDRDVRGYEVHRAEESDTVFVRLKVDTLRTTTHIDSGYKDNTLEPGRLYTWRIVTVDSSGNTSGFAERSLRLVDDEAPDAVRSVLVHNQLGRHVEVTWTGSPSLDVARYVVERVVGDGAATVVATVPSRGTFFVRDTTATKGRLARWRVVAVDSAGNRAAPLGDTLTFRDLTRPPAPRRATAIRQAGVTTVRWERVVSTDLRGYVVYRAERTDGPRTKLTPVPLTVLEFVDRAAPRGVRYVIRSVDASGNESDESPVALVVERP